MSPATSHSGPLISRSAAAAAAVPSPRSQQQRLSDYKQCFDRGPSVIPKALSKQTSRAKKKKKKTHFKYKVGIPRNAFLLQLYAPTCAGICLLKYVKRAMNSWQICRTISTKVTWSLQLKFMWRRDVTSAYVTSQDTATSMWHIVP